LRPVLHLANDQRSTAPTLEAWRTNLTGTDQDLGRIITTIAKASIPLADRLALGYLTGNPAEIVGLNDSGDPQKAMDVAAHDHLMSELATCSIHSVLSEEAEDVILLDPIAPFSIAIDPIDGSGSIGIGAPLGLLFCVFPSEGGFLRSGRDIVAAGYVSFGHSIDMSFSIGGTILSATFDRDADEFRITNTDLRLPETSSTIAYNASNVQFWPQGLQDYISDCLAGKDGPRGLQFNMRWLAAAVGEFHRILWRGGIFLYPADNRDGYQNGRLRLSYEAFPIAYLIEKAGGAATDGTTAILDRTPQSLHENTSLIFGNSAEIAILQDYLTPNSR